MTQENESQVERIPPSVWSACVGVSASRSGKACYYSGQPQWLHSSLSLWELGRDSSPVFDVLLGWVTWILKCIPLTANPVRGFSIVFCFGLVCFSPSFPFLRTLPNSFEWEELVLMVVFCKRFYFWQEWKGSTGIHLYLLFFSIFQWSWFVNSWWLLFEPWLRILIMTSRSGQRVYWEMVLC